MHKLFISIVTFNSAKFIRKCFESLLHQDGFTLGKNLWIEIIDNASSDATIEMLKQLARENVAIKINQSNLGFCAAHNQAAKDFLDSDASFFLTLNPDLVLESKALSNLCQALNQDLSAGSATPKLIRADQNLDPIDIIDACGMYMTDSLRHFDRGSGERHTGQFNQNAYVFGGSGACLLMKRAFVEDLILDISKHEEDLHRLYPALALDSSRRVNLFDEAFFAYREDADLAWRGQLFGWRCLYVSNALGYHVRLVLPERRSQLSQELNRLGVRNRFLLQINNFSCSNNFRSFIFGIIIRNLIVIGAVIFCERSSLMALKQVFCLFRRALTRREQIARRKKTDDVQMARWFARLAYSEGVNGLPK